MKKRCFLPLIIISGIFFLGCKLPSMALAAFQENTATPIPIVIPDTPTPVFTATIAPTATPDNRPVTVQVNADGSGDYPSLEEAVAAVPPGSTIRLSEGTFNLTETLQISKPLHIIGVDPDQTILQGTVTERNMIYFEGPGTFSFQNIWMEYTSSAFGNCMGIENGEEIHIKKSRFSGAKHDDDTEEFGGGVGIWVGSDSTGVIEQSEFSGNQSRGIELSSNASLALISNFSHENSDGIGLFEESVGNLLYNRFENNGDNGIYARDNASLNASDNDIRGNKQEGVFTSDYITAEFNNNQFRENGDVGVAMLGNSMASFSENTITLNGGSGFWLQDNAFAEITNNTSNMNSVDGIYLKDKSSALIRDNDLSGNSWHAILLIEQSQAEIVGNTAKSNGEGGFSFHDSSTGVVSDNIVTNNSKGIYIEKDATVKMSGNQVTGNPEGNLIDLR